MRPTRTMDLSTELHRRWQRVNQGWGVTTRNRRSELAKCRLKELAVVALPNCEPDCSASSKMSLGPSVVLARGGVDIK